MLGLQHHKQELARGLVGDAAVPRAGFSEENLSDLFAPLDS
jgi:hypothetical protein